MRKEVSAMLRLIIGRAGSGKTAAVMEEIAGEYGEDEALEHEILFLRART